MSASNNSTMMMLNNMKPFKVVDAGRDLRMGLTANSLTDLMDRAKAKFDVDPEMPIRVVLEQDGTEIDDNDYFITLEPDTSLMVLCQEERWTPYKSMLSLGLALEPHSNDLNGSSSCSGGCGSTPCSPVEELVWRLNQDLSFFPWLTPKELDTIAKMDTEEMKKVVPDQKFLEFLQDLSERYLQDKESGGRGSGSGSGGSGSSSMSGHGNAVSGSNGVLHDPIKLIRMYSKSSHNGSNSSICSGGHNGYPGMGCGRNHGPGMMMDNGRDGSDKGQVEPKAFRSQ